MLAQRMHGEHFFDELKFYKSQNAKIKEITMAMKKCKECGKNVSSTATACPNCGAVLKKKTGCLTYIVLFFIIFIILGIIGSALSGKKTSNTSISNSQTSTRTNKPSATSGITMAKFKKIKSGMTYEEVVKIIGEEGEETSRVEIPGTPVTVMYMWKAKGFMAMGNMNATFQGNKLTTKAQFGLK